jgi:hypothetical protein
MQIWRRYSPTDRQTDRQAEGQAGVTENNRRIFATLHCEIAKKVTLYGKEMDTSAQ